MLQVDRVTENYSATTIYIEPEEVYKSNFATYPSISWSSALLARAVYGQI